MFNELEYQVLVLPQIRYTIIKGRTPMSSQPFTETIHECQLSLAKFTSAVEIGFESLPPRFPL